MNNSLRDGLAEILATIGVNGIEDKHVVGRAGAIDAILNLIASKMPEKKDVHEKDISINLDNQYVGWNQYHDTFKSILKGEKQ